jgi:hypothetical protein
MPALPSLNDAPRRFTFERRSAPSLNDAQLLRRTTLSSFVERRSAPSLNDAPRRFTHRMPSRITQ